MTLSHPHRADSSFARWQKFLRLHEWNRKSQGSIAPVAERLQRFPFAHVISKEQDILDSVSLLSQGHALLQAALGDSLGYSSSDGRKLTGTPARNRQIAHGFANQIWPQPIIFLKSL